MGRLENWIGEFGSGAWTSDGLVSVSFLQCQAEIARLQSTKRFCLDGSQPVWLLFGYTEHVGSKCGYVKLGLVQI